MNSLSSTGRPRQGLGTSSDVKYERETQTDTVWMNRDVHPDRNLATEAERGSQAYRLLNGGYDINLSGTIGAAESPLVCFCCGKLREVKKVERRKQSRDG